MRKGLLVTLLSVTAMGTTLMAGCASNASTNNNTATESQASDSQVSYPYTIKHAYGTTTLNSEPKKIVTLGWGNQDTALALGIAPVGVSAANFGYMTDHKLHEWTDQAFASLGVSNPNVFNDTDGFDYEAISNAAPDVIIASYSGMTKDEYDRLSQIAPVVPFAEAAWKTSWREQTILNAEGMGKKAEGEKLVAEADNLIKEKIANHPELKDIKAGFFYISPDDFSTFYAYLPADPRASYLQDLGLELPESISKLAQATPDDFSVTISRENASDFSDVDLMVLYGDESLLKALQADPLMSKIPAIKNGAVVLLDSNSKLAASTTPTILSIPATIDDYLTQLSAAASKVGK